MEVTGSPNVAVRFKLGAVGSNGDQWQPRTGRTNVLAANNARALIIWSVANGVKYHRALPQSD